MIEKLIENRLKLLHKKAWFDPFSRRFVENIADQNWISEKQIELLEKLENGLDSKFKKWNHSTKDGDSDYLQSDIF